MDAIPFRPRAVDAHKFAKIRANPGNANRRGRSAQPGIVPARESSTLYADKKTFSFCACRSQGQKNTPQAALAACFLMTSDYQFLTTVSPITRPRSDLVRSYPPGLRVEEFGPYENG